MGNPAGAIAEPELQDWRGGLAIALPPVSSRRILVFRVDLGPGPAGDDPQRLDEWQHLSDDERSRALRFLRPGDRRKFVRGRGALREVLGHVLQVPPDQVAFRVGPGGKPELEPGFGGPSAVAVRFNVTHSGELALIAVGWNRELGIDVEKVRTVAESERIVTAYFTPDEIAEFRNVGPESRDLAFLRGWTRKEAILKARGVGLAGLARRFETRFGTTPLTDQFLPVRPQWRVDEFELWECAPAAGYVATLAIGGEPSDENSRS